MSNSINKKQANDYRIIALCYHESGHVICAIHNCIKVMSASIIPIASDLGETRYETVYELLDLDDLKEDRNVKKFVKSEIQFLYAGLIAEKIYYKDICGSDKFPMHLKEGSFNDIQIISGLISKYSLADPGPERFAFKKEMQDETKKILTEHWETVKLLSHFLYNRKYIEYNEIKYLLCNKSKEKEFWKDKFKKIKSLYGKING